MHIVESVCAGIDREYDEKVKYWPTLFGNIRLQQQYLNCAKLPREGERARDSHQTDSLPSLFGRSRRES